MPPFRLKLPIGLVLGIVSILAPVFYSSSGAAEETEFDVAQHTLYADYERLRQRVRNESEKLGIGGTNGDERVDPYAILDADLDGALLNIQTAQSTRQFLSNSFETLERLRAEMQAARRNPAPDGETATTPLGIEPLDSALVAARSELASVNSLARELDRNLDELISRPDRARVELTAVREELVADAISSKNVLTPLADLRAAVSDLVLRTTADALSQELLAISPRTDIVKQRRLLVDHERTILERNIQSMERTLSTLRQQRAREVGEETRREESRSEALHALPQTIAAENAKFSADLIHLEGVTRRARESLQILSERRQDQFRDFKAVREQLAVSGNFGNIREVLMRQRNALPGFVAQRSYTEERVAEIESASQRQFEVLERLRSLANVNDVAKELESTSSDAPLSTADRSDLVKELSLQRDILESLESGYDRYINALSSMQYESSEFEREATTYREFLDDQMLWIPHTKTFGVKTAEGITEPILWLLQPARWYGAATTLVRTVRYDFPKFVIGLVICALLYFRRQKIIARIDTANRNITSVRTDKLRHTIGAFVFTVLLALPLPLLLAIFGSVLSSSTVSEVFPHALGTGLITAALLSFLFLFVYESCRPAGLAEKHFRWSRSVLEYIRANVRWFGPVYVVARFVWVTAEYSQEALDSSELMRLAATVALAALAVFSYRIFGPERPMLKPILSRGSRVWTMRLSFLWFPLLVAAPVVTIFFVLLGYLYTTKALLVRYEASIALIIFAIVVESLLIRGLNVAQRRLALKRAKAQWEARDQSDTETSAEGSPIKLADSEIDIATVDSQSRQFIRTLVKLAMVFAVWLVWSRMLAFFGDITDFELWRSTEANGADIAVNLRDIMYAGVVLLFAWFAARNLPSLLEIALLQRLPLEPGSRYAIGRIVQYTIGAFGIFYVFSALGISWSKVQWLVAALGVGIGFGLQEIFANFISGLIILFERPVRIGDTVTIGELSGTVSRIRLRTTTIIDWDSKEIVVPNKHLITDRLVNWTLSDSTTRLVIPFGVAYGSDLELTLKLVSEIADEHPLVLKDPPKQLFLLSFGASSLDFELRVFVNQLSDRLPVSHEIMLEIHRALGEHNIEIPFPQRDIRIRSGEALITSPA